MNDETTKRLERQRQRMRETRTGLVALAPGSHMESVLGFHSHPDERPYPLLIAPEKEAFLMPALNADGSRGFLDLVRRPRTIGSTCRSAEDSWAQRRDALLSTKPCAADFRVAFLEGASRRHTAGFYAVNARWPADEDECSDRRSCHADGLRKDPSRDDRETGRGADSRALLVAGCSTWSIWVRLEEKAKSYALRPFSSSMFKRHAAFSAHAGPWQS
jgi:hypothetical protein